MRAKSRISLVTFLFVTFLTNSLFSQDWISMGKEKATPVSIHLIKSDIETSEIEFNLGGYFMTKAAGNENEFVISTPGTNSFLEKGSPDLSKVACSVIIPDQGSMKVEVISSEFRDFENIAIAPSKGNLTRNINPSEIALVKGDVYAINNFWPKSIANLNQPYILRDYRAVPIFFNPFQYNPVTKTLRVFSQIKVKISHVNDLNGINEFTRLKPLLKIDPEYAAIYNRQFLNYNSVQYVPLGEQGDLLIICYSQWMNLMQPLVDWKIKKGIHTTLVDINNAGGSSALGVQNFIANYYLTHNLTYVLLVGDITQVPSLYSAGGVSDPVYGFISGNDAYSEVFIGRFSAEFPQDVTTQVDRTLNYEMFADTSQIGYSNAVVIGSNQGPGDDGEMDWEHAHNMGTDFLSFNYSQLTELYDSTHLGTNDAPGDPTSQDLINSINSGAGVITYTGHGSSTSFGTTGFSSANISSLTTQPNLPIIWSVACVNGDFAQTTGPCLAETFLRSKNNGLNAGAAATFMASINQTWNPPMDAQDEMVDILTHLDTSNFKRSFAGLSFNGCFHMNDQYGNQGAEMTSTWHVFGDPTLDVRTATPSEMIVTHPSTIYLGDSILTVNCNEDFAKVCFTLQGSILSIGDVLNGISTLTFPALNVVDTIFVTVTAFNKIPYRGFILILPSSVPFVIYQSHINHDYNGNKDGLLDYSELISMDVSLKDLSFVDALNTSAKLTTSDTNVVMITNTFQPWGTISGNSIIKKDSVFTFLIKNDVPDQHIVEFLLTIMDNVGHTWTSKINQIINAPSLEITSVSINDSIGGNNNKRLESNETASMIFRCKNKGHSDAFSCNSLLTTMNSFLTLNTNTKSFGTLNKQTSKDISFNVSMGPNVATGTPYDVTLRPWSGMYDTTQTFTQTAGDIIEDFETGDFTKFNWITRGPALWSVINVQPYQGLFSALSGNINDGERTDLEITLNVLANDSISFWYKVSSEPGWDFMRFYEDGTQLAEWSGSISWSYFTYPIEAGVHLLTFSYQKDLINSYGSDCAWLDNVRFPYSATITSLNAISNTDNNISIFPNPANTNFNVVVDNKVNSNTEIAVFDLKGCLIEKQSFSNLSIGKQKLKMDCKELIDGLYLVKVSNINNIQTSKLNVHH